jgi:hypothetical protein
MPTTIGSGKDLMPSSITSIPLLIVGIKWPLFQVILDCSWSAALQHQDE